MKNSLVIILLAANALPPASAANPPPTRVSAYWVHGWGGEKTGLFSSDKLELHPYLDETLTRNARIAKLRGAEFFVLNIESQFGGAPTRVWREGGLPRVVEVLRRAREAIRDTGLKLGISTVGELSGSASTTDAWARHAFSIHHTTAQFVDGVFPQVYLRYDRTADEHAERVKKTVALIREAVKPTPCEVVIVVGQHYPPHTWLRDAEELGPLSAEHVAWVRSAVADVRHTVWRHPRVLEALRNDEQTGREHAWFLGDKPSRVLRPQKSN